MSKLNWLGFAATSIGLAATTIDNYAKKKEMEKIINEKVNKAVDKRMSNNNMESK